ncbi:hypothetical protein P7C70_g2434, partial [Phenoliferia sp. Uapishka_3]
MPAKRKISKTVAPKSNDPSNSNVSKTKVVKSCGVCHSRKVKCSLELPACTACRRHAKTLGEDPDLVVCVYQVPPPPREAPMLLAEEPLQKFVADSGRSLRVTEGRLRRGNLYREEEDFVEESEPEAEDVVDAPERAEETVVSTERTPTQPRGQSLAKRIKREESACYSPGNGCLASREVGDGCRDREELDIKPILAKGSLPIDPSLLDPALVGVGSSGNSHAVRQNFGRSLVVETAGDASPRIQAHRTPVHYPHQQSLARSKPYKSKRELPQMQLPTPTTSPTSQIRAFTSLFGSEPFSISHAPKTEHPAEVQGLSARDFSRTHDATQEQRLWYPGLGLFAPPTAFSSSSSAFSSSAFSPPPTSPYFPGGFVDPASTGNFPPFATEGCVSPSWLH